MWKVFTAAGLASAAYADIWRPNMWNLDIFRENIDSWTQCSLHEQDECSMSQDIDPPGNFDRFGLWKGVHVPPPTSRVKNDLIKNYEPTEEELFITVSNGDYQRVIFNGRPLREKEQRELENFRQWLKDNNLELPPGYDDENRFSLRFLQCLKWNYQATYDEIYRHREWRGNLPLNYDALAHDLELGVVYGAGRDKSNRPIIVCNVRRMMDV